MLLLCELLIIGCLTGGRTNGIFLAITNLGVTNLGMMRALSYLKDWGFKERGHKEHSTILFIKISSFASFIHHTLVLSVILGLVVMDPNYFEHWKRPDFFINKYSGHKYPMFIVPITLGIIGLAIVNCQNWSIIFGAKLPPRHVEDKESNGELEMEKVNDKQSNGEIETEQVKDKESNGEIKIEIEIERKEME